MDRVAAFAWGRNPVVVFLICIVLLALKAPDAVLRPQFWAEDGTIFFAQQLTSNWPALLTPYAGYLHIVPRLIAWATIGIDPHKLPTVYNAIAIVIQAGLIAYAVLRMSPLFGTTIAVAAFFLTPTVGDIFSTMTNIQWFAQFALVFGVLDGRQTGPYRIRDGLAAVLILLIGLTGPFAVILTLVLVAAWIFTKAPLGATLGRAAPFVRDLFANIEPARLCALFLGAGAQIAIMATHKLWQPAKLYVLTDHEKELYGWTDSLSPYLYTLQHPFGPYQLVIAAAYILIVLMAIAQYLRQPTHKGTIVMIALAFGLAQPVMGFARQREFHILASTSHYFYFLGVVAFCVAAERLTAIQDAGRRTAVAAAAVAGLTLIFVLHPNLLVRPAFEDMHWDEYAAKIATGEKNIVAPLNPGWRLVAYPAHHPVTGAAPPISLK